MSDKNSDIHNNPPETEHKLITVINQKIEQLERKIQGTQENEGSKILREQPDEDRDESSNECFKKVQEAMALEEDIHRMVDELNEIIGMLESLVWETEKIDEQSLAIITTFIQKVITLHDDVLDMMQREALSHAYMQKHFQEEKKKYDKERNKLEEEAYSGRDTETLDTSKDQRKIFGLIVTFFIDADKDLQATQKELKKEKDKKKLIDGFCNDANYLPEDDTIFAITEEIDRMKPDFDPEEDSEEDSGEETREETEEETKDRMRQVLSNNYYNALHGRQAVYALALLQWPRPHSFVVNLLPPLEYMAHMSERLLNILNQLTEQFDDQEIARSPNGVVMFETIVETYLLLAEKLGKNEMQLFIQFLLEQYGYVNTFEPNKHILKKINNIGDLWKNVAQEAISQAEDREESRKEVKERHEEGPIEIMEEEPYILNNTSPQNEQNNKTDCSDTNRPGGSRCSAPFGGDL